MTPILQVILQLLPDAGQYINSHQVKIIGSDITGGCFVIKSTVAGFNPQPIKVNMKVFTEGLYNINTNRLNRKDTVTVYLRNNTSPYAIVDSPRQV
ncbi:MAG: hypothetical protein R3A12_17875 [Ignavibacteria bacterium]